MCKPLHLAPSFKNQEFLKKSKELVYLNILIPNQKQLNFLKKKKELKIKIKIKLCGEKN